MPQRSRTVTLLAACRASCVEVALAACAFELPAAPATGELFALQLMPAGAFLPSDDREMRVSAWRIDADIAAKVIARYNARKNPAVLDYEHQTLRTEDNGQPAPAAGWIRSLEWRPGSGLWANVELTARAAQLIAAGEYRYVSPVFAYDAASGEVLAITMAAITNNPAIDGMEPLALRAAATFGFTTDSDEDPSMNKLLAALCALLGLDADKTNEDQAVAACAALKPKLEALAQVRKELGIDEGKEVGAAELVTACTALKQRAEAGGAPDPKKYVEVSVVEALKTDIAALRSEQTGRDVGELVAAGLADGRLLEAQKDWATKLGTSDIAALRAYLDSAAPIAALRSTQTGGQQPAGGEDENGLTQAELAVCSATGIAPKEFAAAKAA